jgi:hypothetical protein
VNWISVIGTNDWVSPRLDVGGVDRRGDCDLADVAEGGSLGVDDGRTHEGGDGRPMVGVLRHSDPAADGDGKLRFLMIMLWIW